MDEEKKTPEAGAPAGEDKYETLYEKHKENIYFRWGLTAFIVIVACILAAQLITKLPLIYAWVLGVAKTLSSVLYGLGIAYVLDPIVERVEQLLQPRLSRKMKNSTTAANISRGTGIIIALIVLGLVLWALIAMVLPQLIESIVAIVNNLPEYYNTISTWVLARVEDLDIAGYTETVMNSIYDYLMNFLSDTVLPQLQSMVVTLTSSVVGLIRGLVNILIGVIVSVYLLAGKRRFLAQGKKIIYAVCGTRNGNTVCNVCTYANRVFGSFIGGKLMDSLIIGVLCFAGMSLLKLPYAILIAVIIGCTNIIPVFGPFLGAIPSALFLLVVNPINALTFVIFILILQQLDGNIIGPLILGDATGISSFWVVVAILIFGGMWGVPGMIIGVPLFAVIYKIIAEVINHYLDKRGLSTVTEQYVAADYPKRTGVETWLPKTRKQRRQHRRELRALQKLDRLHLLHLDIPEDDDAAASVEKNTENDGKNE